jgi:myo-inositol catabolism protein IolC
MCDPLFILAFDHRSSLPSTLGIDEELNQAAPVLTRTKEIVFDGLTRAAEALAHSRPAMLVDERLGGAVARKVREAGLALAMPAERSGETLFEFEYPDWRAHIEQFEPDLVKVLVRWNPEGDREGNERQGARLAQLSTWLSETARPLMVELLVPATNSQLADERFDLDRRPALATTAMREIRVAGVEPAIWKLEGVDRSDQALALTQTAQEGGRDDVRCVVLGRGADTAQVNRWLRVAAPVPGFDGFAIGRSIWADPLRDWLADEAGPETTAEAVARNYRAFVDVYQRAGGGAQRR